MSWQKSGSPVRLANPRLKLTSHGLRVSRARADDRGKYRCVVKNQAGSAERLVTLMVSGEFTVAGLYETHSVTDIIYGG